MNKRNTPAHQPKGLARATFKKNAYRKLNEVDVNSLLTLADKVAQSRVFNFLPRIFQSGEDLPIASMYVDLGIASEIPRVDPYRLVKSSSLSEELDKRFQESSACRVSLKDTIDNPEFSSMVILGDPGSGKTSLMKQLCLQIAVGNYDQWFLPIYIPLRQYWYDIRKSSTTRHISLLRYACIRFIAQNKNASFDPGQPIQLDIIDEQMNAEITKQEHLLLAASGTERRAVLFILDGFDEVASQPEAIEGLHILTESLGQYFSWVMTSRYTGFPLGLHGKQPVYEVVPLDDDGVESIVSKWFDVKNDEAAGGMVGRELLAEVKTSHSLENMARNPFLLTLLCYLKNEDDGKLPLRRCEVYDRIVKIIIKQHHQHPPQIHQTGFTDGDVISRLESFSHYLYTDADGAPLQLFDSLHWVQYQESKELKPKDLVSTIMPLRLLNQWGIESDFHFVHLSFQEYFIAKHISKLSFESIKPFIYQPIWREVIRFLGGIYYTGGEHGQKKFQQLINAFLEPMDLSGRLYVEAAWILVEAGVEDSREMGHEKDLRDILWSIWRNRIPYVASYAALGLAVLSPNYILAKYQAAYTQGSQYTGEDIIIGMQSDGIGGGTPSDESRTCEISAFFRLLGYVRSSLGEEQLIDLFTNEHSRELLPSIIDALARKDSNYLRQKISSIATSNPTLYFDRLCKFISLSPHSFWISWLLIQLDSPPVKLVSLKRLFNAFRAVGDPSVDQDLIKFANTHYASEPVEDFIVRTIASLKTLNSIQWIKKHLSSNERQFNCSYLSAAIEYGLLVHNEIEEIISTGNIETRKEVISDITDACKNGGIFSVGIFTLLQRELETKGVSCDKASDAIASLVENLTVRKNYPISRPLFRKLLHTSNNKLRENAIKVLGLMVDQPSVSKLIDLAHQDSNIEIRILSIYSLEHFTRSNKTEITATLKDILVQVHPKYLKSIQPVESSTENEFAELLNTLPNGEVGIIKAALETLAKIDPRELAEFVHWSISKDIFSSISAEQNLLFLNNGFIDLTGTLHQWRDYLYRYLPALEYSRINILEPRYINDLRQICHYLLNSKRAKQALGVGRDAESHEGQLPLFARDDGETWIMGERIKSIGRRAGRKFLKNETEPTNEASYIRLVDHLIKYFPEVYDWAVYAYGKELHKIKHNVHIIAGSASHLRASGLITV